MCYSFLEARLESLKKDREIEVLENKNAQNELKRTFLWGSLGLMFILGLAIFNSQRKLLRKEKLLVEVEKDQARI